MGKSASNPVKVILIRVANNAQKIVRATEKLHQVSDIIFYKPNPLQTLYTK